MTKKEKREEVKRKEFWDKSDETTTKVVFGKDVILERVQPTGYGTYVYEKCEVPSTAVHFLTSEETEIVINYDPKEGGSYAFGEYEKTEIPEIEHLLEGCPGKNAIIRLSGHY